MPDYLPRAEGALRDWVCNFSAVVNANPSTLGLMPSDADSIAAAVGSFTAALTAATDPSTRTRGTVAAKDSAKAAMLITLRRYARFIKLNVSVTNAEKAALGLTIDSTNRTPAAAPTTPPVCAIIDVGTLSHTLRYADASTPTRRAKPPGVMGLQLYGVVGPHTSSPPACLPIMPGGDVTFYGLMSRWPFTVTHDPSRVGQTATYYARWVTSNGLTGPWSAPVSMTVAA